MHYAGSCSITSSVSARKSNLYYCTTPKHFRFRLCNSICTSKQWSPEQDPVRLQTLQATAKTKIDERDAEALELKYSCYPSTRPPGWVDSTQPLIDTDDNNEYGHNDHDDDCDNDYYNASGFQQGPQHLSQHFQQHLLHTESGPNPDLNNLFGHSKMERLEAKSELLQQKRRRGRPRKA